MGANLKSQSIPFEKSWVLPLPVEPNSPLSLTASHLTGELGAPALSSPEPTGWVPPEAAASCSRRRALLTSRAQSTVGAVPRHTRLLPPLADHLRYQGQKLYAPPHGVVCPQSILEQDPNVQKRVCCEFQECFPVSGFCACEMD